MQTSGYYVLIFCIFLVWAFSDSFQIIDSLPSNNVERNLYNYLSLKQSLKKNRLRSVKGLKEAIKYRQKTKNYLNVCKLSPAQKFELCTSILKDTRYNIESSINKKVAKKCTRRKITVFGEPFLVNMVTCKSDKSKDLLYFLSATGNEQPSVHLFHEVNQKKENAKTLGNQLAIEDMVTNDDGSTRVGEDIPISSVDALITLSQKDMENLKKIREDERFLNRERRLDIFDRFGIEKV